MGIRVLIGAPRSTSGDLTAEEMRREWEGILALPGVGEIRYCEAPYTDIGALGEAAEGCSAIIGVRVDPSFINERLFAANPQIRYVASLAHGYGDIDMEMTRRHGVTVTNTVYGAGTIAQYTMALLLEICNNVRLHSDYIQKTDWSAGRQRFMYSLKPQIELEGLAFGVVGLGAIGLRAAGMARAFGMEALACSRSQKRGPEYGFVRQTSFERLLAEADVVSLHASLTPETRGLIDRAAIARMKDGVIILNTARGALIDEDALADALDSGKVYAAGLDVLSQEPPQGRLRIFGCENAITTGHIAFLPRQSRLRAIRIAIRNYAAYLEGRPVSVVNAAGSAPAPAPGPSPAA